MPPALAIHELMPLLVGLLLLAAATSVLSRWSRLPFSVSLVLADIALRQLAEQGPESLEALHRLPISSDLILLIFLPTLVFESAFNLDGRQLRHNLLPVLILVVPGVVLSTALMGGYSGWSHPWT
jgi:CPA1 family monovalent cation:H+ antiporter